LRHFPNERRPVGGKWTHAGSASTIGFGGAFIIAGCKIVGMEASSVKSSPSESSFPQVDGILPILTSLLPVFEGKRPRKAVFGAVATCPKSRTGYHPFPQVRAFTPQTQGIYSPLLATRVVAAFWLPTGYHPEPGFHGVFPDVGAWFDTSWTWKHVLEKLELSSGNSNLRPKARIIPFQHDSPSSANMLTRGCFL